MPRYNFALVFDDWRDRDGQSVYHTEIGLELSAGPFHSGTTWPVTITMDTDHADELVSWLAAGCQPIFRLVRG